MATRPNKRRRTEDGLPSLQTKEPSRTIPFHDVPRTPGTLQSLPKLVEDAASRFHQQLQDLQVIEKKNNSLITSQINPSDIPVLVQFFFSNTFGEACQKRMLALFDEINLQGQTSTPTKSLAAQKAKDKTLLPEMQDFFLTYAKWHTEEEKHNQITVEILGNVRAFELYHAFFQLREKASGPKGDELRAFLEAQGFPTSIGRDVRSCILKYLAQELNVSSSQLSNTLQAYQGIFLLAQQFGRGILVLLPKGASHR